MKGSLREGVLVSSATAKAIPASFIPVAEAKARTEQERRRA
jgi:hypothetical protein